jgi:hypothetical protein
MGGLMTGDELEVEAQLSGILDRLGLEMQQAAMRLRFAPYCTVEEFINHARTVLKDIRTAGELSKRQQIAAALQLISLIEVPEIEFADEE